MIRPTHNDNNPPITLTLITERNWPLIASLYLLQKFGLSHIARINRYFDGSDSLVTRCCNAEYSEGVKLGILANIHLT